MKHLQAYWPAILWASLIFVLSSIPGDRYPSVDVPSADKMVHALIYMPLGFLLGRGAAAAGTRAGAGNLWAIVVGCAYGLSDELHQLFVRNRTCSMYDFVIDCLGVLLGVAVWSRYHARFGKRP